MSETKFTPAPWKAEYGSVVTDYKPDTKRIHGYGADNDFVCDLNDGEYHEYYSADEQEANTNLIAAAPELYEALDRLVNWIETEYGCTERVNDAVEAMAKARGETQA